MDRLFATMIDQFTPRVNGAIMDGLACIYMQQVEEYIHNVFLSVSRSFPKGLAYIGYERCTPYEEFMEVSKPQNNKRTYDISKSDIYLVRYKFTFEGQPIPDRYIYLPYVREAGIIHLWGAKMHITPVLSDKVISPGFDTVFVRLLRDKMIFKRCLHSFIVNGERESQHVVWSNIYRKSKNGKKVQTTTKAESCLVHYLFGKFGVTGTYKKFCGFKPIIGGQEINEHNYPSDKWVLCQSSQVRPKTFLGEFYKQSEVRIAIPVEHWNNLSKQLTVGLFYCVDHFPTRLTLEFIDNEKSWKILLGHILFSGVYGENKLYGDICEHYNSIDDYVDTIIIEKLRETGYIVNDFYDLLALLVDKFNDLVLDNDNAVLNMYGKSLEILYYVLYDITSSIMSVNFKLNKLASTRKPLTVTHVTEIFNKNMKMRAIRNLASGKIVVEAVAYSGDHKYPKLTSKVTEQESLPGGTRGKSKRFVLGQDKHLDISMVEAGSILFLPKSNPSPTSKINPFINIDLKSGTILPNPKFHELRELTDKRLKGKQND